jgi:hypothetical protein
MHSDVYDGLKPNIPFIQRRNGEFVSHLVCFGCMLQNLRTGFMPRISGKKIK